MGAKIGLRGPRDDSDFFVALVNGAICGGSYTEGAASGAPTTERMRARSDLNKTI